MKHKEKSNQIIQRIQTLEEANCEKSKLITNQKQEIQYLQEENRRLSQHIANIERAYEYTVA